MKELRDNIGYYLKHLTRKMSDTTLEKLKNSSRDLIENALFKPVHNVNWFSINTPNMHSVRHSICNTQQKYAVLKELSK